MNQVNGVSHRYTKYGNDSNRFGTAGVFRKDTGYRFACPECGARFGCEKRLVNVLREIIIKRCSTCENKPRKFGD